MKPIIAIVLVACCFWVAQGAYAQGTVVITFDGPPLQPPGTAFTTTNYSESGMLFLPLPPSFGYGRIGSSPEGGRPDDGSAYLQAALTDSLLFSASGGSPFELVSVDLAEYSMLYQEPLTVHFIGYYSNGSTVTTSFITDGIIDGTGPLADFQTFTFGSEWTDLIRVDMPGWRWSLDNVVIGGVPEPSSAALLLLGGGFLWLARRKSRQTAVGK
jgi:hypothetical protein